MYKLITDPKQMDELWYAGLLWCRDYIDKDSNWGDWWLDTPQSWSSPKGNEPSKYVACSDVRSEFAVLLED